MKKKYLFCYGLILFFRLGAMRLTEKEIHGMLYYQNYLELYDQSTSKTITIKRKKIPKILSKFRDLPTSFQVFFIKQLHANKNLSWEEIVNKCQLTDNHKTILIKWFNKENNLKPEIKQVLSRGFHIASNDDSSSYIFLSGFVQRDVVVFGIPYGEELGES